MFGERNKVAWDPFAIGPSFSLSEWRNFSTQAQRDNLTMLQGYMGVVIMMAEVREVIAWLENVELASGLND